MDESIFQPLQQYVLPHWPFLFMSFALGTIGQFFKKKVWTIERAKKKGGAWAVMHQTLGIHAPVIGALAGVFGAPVSPGVTGLLGRALYHFVAGAMASWTVAAFKHFMASRGIVLADSLTPPPTTPSLMPDADDKTPTLPTPPPPAGKS